jgi:Rab GDP dissociation inhibitor
VAAKDWFIAMVSTTVETANPEDEIQPGIALLGPVKQKFIQVLISTEKFSVQNFPLFMEKHTDLKC